MTALIKSQTLALAPCEQTAYSSLLTLAGAVLAKPEPMLARLVRGCIAMAFTASVPADQSTHRLADPVKGCGCMGPVTEREQTAYSSLLRRLHTVQADPGAMPPRLIRSRLA